MHHLVSMQYGQHHVAVASQSWYMESKLHYDANDKLSCFADCPQPEFERYFNQQKKCSNQGSFKTHFRLLEEVQ